MWAGIRFPSFPRFPPHSAAAQVFAAARSYGIRLSVNGGFIEWEAERSPPDELLAPIATAKLELIEILRGDRCRCCGERLAWPGPAGVIFADSTAECMRCADREAWRLLVAAERVVNSPDALADQAEVMLRGLA